jgi:hypothetical protein
MYFRKKKNYVVRKEKVKNNVEKRGYGTNLWCTIFILFYDLPFIFNKIMK